MYKNSYFTRSELQDQSLEKFSNDLEYLKRAVTSPGEPYRFNWTFGAISQRASTLLSMLAKEPENGGIRSMLEEYRRLEDQAFALAMQPPYLTSREPSNATPKLKVSISKMIRKVATYLPIF